MSKKLKNICIALITLIAIALIVMIGPCDKFTHGYFGEEIECGQIAAEDVHEGIDLSISDYSMTFVPQKNHMAGVEIYLINQPEGNTGYLNLKITDKNDSEIDSIDVDLAKVVAASWYKVSTDANLKKGEEYTLTFSVKGSLVSVPYLLTIDSDYLPDETTSGEVLLCYAYAEPTFTLQNKVIIFLFMVAIWLFAVSLFADDREKKMLRYSTIFVLCVSALAWNYMYNSMDDQNTTFASFQAGSETLVTGVIYAEEDSEYFRGEDERGFGLGIYYDLKGRLREYGLTYLTDDNWLNGYSRNESALIVNSNAYSKEIAVAGNQIRFENGEMYQISAINDDGSNIVIYLNSGKILTSAKYGSLDDAEFLDANGDILHKSLITAYKSQYGLQGKVFRHLARYMEDSEELLTLNLICALAAAVVFMIIVVLIAIKYNNLLAGCFLVTFWLSPWIVNFARNLYWVEFTWFIPMAIGLICSLKINSRKWRVACYIATFIAITGKCLCGYEYITVVMMGLIAFLLVDFICAAISKDKENAKLLFKTIVIIGTVALAGFIMAICIHAPLKGDGSIREGIKNIFEQDVLRRTIGSDLNEFREVYWPSFNSSVWEVYSKYFHFKTEVIIGITGNLFPLVCLVPLAIFAYEYKNKKVNVQLLVMYVVFFLTSISWFILAKSHSYIHTHMNYVLWYFGYVQICLYIVINKIVSTFRGLQKKQIEE